MTYSSGTGSTAYLNGTYYISTSSHQRQGVSGTDTYNGVTLGLPFILFSAAKNRNVFYNSGYTGSFTFNEFNSALTYTQGPYNSGRAYQGGGGGVGAANYFRTTYNTSLTVDGEYWQTRFPFKILITKLEMLVRDANTTGNRVPANITILGSDDGTTWTLVQSVTLTVVSGSVGLSNVTVTTSSYYYYYRFVITTLKTASQGMINICQFRITGNSYSNV